uniref:glycosyltransferase family 2 protein n=1 Tax=Pseudobutyrivibrio sp. TaxID=2014367 RepID=UPI003867CB69
MKGNINISIIIPVYNAEKYIGRCLNSIICQTYSGKIECILVNDCGNDDGIRKAEHFIERYKGDINF